jgi:diaminobutyrate-2-oxoglutarate transaminase
MDLQSIERHESNVRSYVRAFPTVFSTAEGAWLTDIDGRRYLDFFAGAGTLNYGHNNPHARQAILDYVQNNGITHGLDMATEAKVELIQAFQEIILQPRGLDYRIQFTGPTGTNAVEAALKLARKTTKRSHVVAFTNAYHGHSLGALALTGNRYYHDEHYGSHNNVSHLPYDGYLGDFDSSLLFEKMLDDPSSGLPIPAAVIVELVQGEGGINVASNAWTQRIAKICQRHGIWLIVDDIQVGNGRTGDFFSFESSGISPDIVCMSKAIGGGLPMSLLLIKPECDQWKPAEHTGTFRGNNLAFVASRALLNYWKDNSFVRSIAEHEKTVRSALFAVAAEHAERNWKVRGRGMVWGLDVGQGELAGAVSKAAFRRGLIIETCGAHDQVIKLLPPLTITKTELESGLRIIAESIDEVLSSKQESSWQVPTAVAPLVSNVANSAPLFASL